MTQYNVHKVSICIPTYNYGRFIADAIESVLNQTFSDYELIISDNCSDDNTRQVVENYTKIDSRIRYYCNEQNIGMVGNWNRCLELAQGEYVKILCADDLLEPTCLEESVNALECHPNAALVSCARLLVGSTNSGAATLSYADSFQLLPGVDAIKRCLDNGNIIGEPTAVLFRKRYADRGFDAAYRQITDLEMWFHILENGQFAFVPRVLCQYRQHEGQETRNNLRSLSIAEDQFALYGTYFKKSYIDFSYLKKQEVMFNVALQVWKQRENRARAFGCIKQHYGLVNFFTMLTLKKVKRLFFR